MKGWFSRRERRALVVFVALGGLFLLGLLLVERRDREEAARRTGRRMEAVGDSVRRFEFDPNTVEYADLRRLGLSERAAVGLLRYRAAGKVFRIPEDVALCYGMTDSLYFLLAPYIRIAREYTFAPRRSEPSAQAERCEPKSRRIVPPDAPFRIDTATVACFVAMGFSERQAEALLRYRDRAGGLRDEAGLRACYLIADSVADLLLPLVIFPEREPHRPRGPVEINGADSAALRSVAGIGPKSVAAILRYRERLGGFHSLEQLAEIPQVTEANFERIVQQICCDSCKIRKIDINFVAPSVLKGHPYIPPAALRRLLSKRQLKGGWSTAEELVEDHILTPKEAERLAPYLRFTVRRNPGYGPGEESVREPHRLPNENEQIRE